MTQFDRRYPSFSKSQYLTKENKQRYPFRHSLALVTLETKENQESRTPPTWLVSEAPLARSTPLAWQPPWTCLAFPSKHYCRPPMIHILSIKSVKKSYLLICDRSASDNSFVCGARQFCFSNLEHLSTPILGASLAASLVLHPPILVLSCHCFMLPFGVQITPLSHSKLLTLILTKLAHDFERE